MQKRIAVFPPLPILLAVLVACAWLPLRAAQSADFEALSKEAGDNFDTKEGRSYFEQFEKAITPVFTEALKTCSESSPDTEEPVAFIFVIAADGTVKRLLHTTDVPFGESMASKLKEIKSVPPPPHDNWVVAMGAANHWHAKPPVGIPDREVHTRGQQQVMDMEKAIAPYVAEARNTYPAAKKRFLAGLPPGNAFSVWLPLIQKDGNREYSFVDVQSIADGNISGIVSSDLNLVTEFKKGDRITFPESKIQNWVIVRPDGTEEGNPVGKFLDTYHPK